MSAIAKAELIVPGMRGGIVRPRRDGLRLECLNRRPGWHLRRDHGCDGNFTIHGYDGNQFMIARTDEECAVKYPLNFSGDA
jgi:hypothetical protein